MENDKYIGRWMLPYVQSKSVLILTFSIFSFYNMHANQMLSSIFLAEQDKMMKCMRRTLPTHVKVKGTFK